MSTIIPSWDEIYKQQQELLATDKQKKKDETAAIYDSKAQVTQQQYDTAVKDTEAGYSSDYQKNAVQKLINEQQIAENMANMGLTDSGLNRTQQTAVQLSYANQNASIDNSRRKALSDLSSALASGLATIEQEKISAMSQIDTDYDTAATEQANTIYNSYIDLYEAEQKAASKENNDEGTDVVIQKWYGETNEDGLLKFIGSDNKSKYVTPGKNPYTNSQNAKVTVDNGKCVVDEEWQKKNKQNSNMIVRACARYGVFGNGYQPKGICYIDENGTAHDAGKVYNTGSQTYVNGNLQTIWKTANGQEWIWNGDKNCYQPYEEE